MLEALRKRIREFNNLHYGYFLQLGITEEGVIFINKYCSGDQGIDLCNLHTAPIEVWSAIAEALSTNNLESFEVNNYWNNSAKIVVDGPLVLLTAPSFEQPIVLD